MVQVAPVALVQVQVTAEVSQPALLRAIVKVVQGLTLPNYHQARVIHMVALDQILATLHLITAGDCNDLIPKVWVLDLEVLEWALIVVRAEHQITADNLLAPILHETNP